MRRATVTLAAFAAALVLAPAAGATPASYKGASADGTIVFFETADQLVPGDTDAKRDVYERSYDSEPGIESYVTRDVSLGPTGGNDAYNATFEKANEAGTKVFFTTEEALVEEDTDHHLDVYMREPETGRTTLVSRGEAACFPGCGNGSSDAGFAAASADGEKVFLVTQEKLTANDKDNSLDIYERNLATEKTILVSAGSASCPTECGNGPHNATLWGISHNGSYMYFTTEEALAPQDGDATTDIYVREIVGAETRLASQAAEGCTGCGNEGQVPVFLGNSTAGTRVFFSTDEKLVGADGDGATDIYARDLPAGPTILVSGGSEAKTATFAANSADGQHVFFNTVEPLLPVEDQDTTSDVYEWTAGGPLRLVTSAPCASSCDATFNAASTDSQTVIFSTAAQLSGEDQDNAQDIYSQPVGGGAPTLVSRGCGGCGNGAEDARFDHASADAGHVVFTSKESLSPEDKDIEDDIYSRDLAGEATSLITTSPSYCPLTKGHCGATYVDASADGRRVFFTTVERFTLEDGDNESDVYERFLGATPAEDVTRLVSAGNSPDLELGPPAPKLEGTNPVSPAASTAPKVFGEAEPGSTVKLYTNSGCTGEPVAHGSAAQFASPGIGVTVGAGETAQFWATAEAEGFVSLCAGPIAYQQESASQGGGGGGGGEEEGGGGSGGGGGDGGGEKPKVIVPGNGEQSAYVTPHTQITFAPASKTRSHNPTFRFKDSTGQQGTRFRCKVDRHSWRSCHSPLRLKKLSRGRHKLEIRAVNAVGISEPHPAVRKFKVVPR